VSHFGLAGMPLFLAILQMKKIVNFGIDAPKAVNCHRSEIYTRSAENSDSRVR
jgi:sRNA-binding carbon storage regulator CsrA